MRQRGSTMTGPCFLASIAVIVHSACVTPQESPFQVGSQAENAATSVVIRNGSFNDVRVAVEASRGRWLVGHVRSGERRVLRIPAAAASSEFRLVATWGAGNQALRSPIVRHVAGMRIEWNVGSYEPTSVLTVRPA